MPGTHTNGDNSQAPGKLQLFNHVGYVNEITFQIVVTNKNYFARWRYVATFTLPLPELSFLIWKGCYQKILEILLQKSSIFSIITCFLIGYDFVIFILSLG